MKKIIETFKNLYNGENSFKNHLTLVGMFLLPALLGVSIQFLDNDFLEFRSSVFVLIAVFSLLSIVPLLFLIGYYFNFIHKRLNGETSGLPVIDWNSVVRGVKTIPLYFVWGLYILIPFLIYSFALVLLFGSTFLIGGANVYSFVLSVFVLILGGLLAFIPLFIITPFIMAVYFKYSENFEYQKSLFNPLLPFKFMKKAFKEFMMVALKYLAVALVTNIAFQFIIGLVMLIIVLFAVSIVIISSNATTFGSNPIFISVVLLVSGIFGMLSAYVSQMVGFAYTDNLIDVYKDKIMEKEVEVETEIQEEE